MRNASLASALGCIIRTNVLILRNGKKGCWIMISIRPVARDTCGTLTNVWRIVLGLAVLLWQAKDTWATYRSHQKSGDLICLSQHVPCPFLTRSLYWVGFAYVHGIMNGEALKSAKREDGEYLTSNRRARFSNQDLESLLVTAWLVPVAASAWVRVAARGGGWLDASRGRDHGGSAIRQRIVRCRVHCTVRHFYPFTLFPFFLFPSFCWDSGT